MTTLSQQLLAQIRQVATELPTPILHSVIRVLTTDESNCCDQSLKVKLLQHLPKAHLRSVVADLIETWQAEGMHLDSKAIATALATAAHCDTSLRQELSVELVWTGPNPKVTPLRRTDQVLLQLIREAKQEIIIVSFAVYKVPEIAKALMSAMNEGVSLRIIAETPESSEGKIPFGVRAALGAKILQQAKVLVWPVEQRPVDKNGRYGSLHVKCAIADEKHLFISSANLTEYALTLNMEMGLLVHSEDLARQVTEHIDQLIHQGILVPLQLDV